MELRVIFFQAAVSDLIWSSFTDEKGVKSKIMRFINGRKMGYFVDKMSKGRKKRKRELAKNCFKT